MKRKHETNRQVVIAKRDKYSLLKGKAYEIHYYGKSQKKPEVERMN
ncbi:uncharacterized protein G2W53_007381 [Senna tora]|uniref:Uncharacterized protein n=1 Tax=Senna tora TaxID=362788 RepID=A0A834X6A5_9FABA|nr:uncharacterized protein G2W53_007381 [Senna tora]